METVDELEARYLRDMAKRYGDAVPAYRLAWEAYQELKRCKRERNGVEKTCK